MIEVVLLGFLVSIMGFLGISFAQKISQALLVFMVSLMFIELILKREVPSKSNNLNQLQSQNLNTRLSALTQALEDAGQVINSIEFEIQSRQDLVNKLESQKAIAEKAITLSKEQVDAVAAILSHQVSRRSDADSRRELFKDIAIFVAGIMVSVILHWLGVL
jgi:hypothetical protein